MRFILLSFMFAASISSSSAFATNPCTSKVLMQITCAVTDAADDTTAEIIITRAITTGGRSSFCTNGITEESMSAYAHFPSDGSIKRVDLLFPSTKIVNPVATIERNGTFEADLYSAGLMLQDLQSTVSISSINGNTTAKLSLRARNLKIFSAQEAPVTINGSAVCQESLN